MVFAVLDAGACDVPHCQGLAMASGCARTAREGAQLSGEPSWPGVACLEGFALAVGQFQELSGDRRRSAAGINIHQESQFVARYFRRSRQAKWIASWC